MSQQRPQPITTSPSEPYAVARNRGGWVAARIRNVGIPYLLSFMYRVRKPASKVYDINVKSVGMPIKLRLNVTGECAFPIVDTMLLRRMGIYEQETSVVLRDELRIGDTVLELGAAEGYFAVQMAKFVGLTGRIYSFEPNKNFYADLLFNAELNGCQNVIAKNVGLGKSSETFVDGNDNSFITQSLGDFLQPLDKPIDFIFIDVDAKTSDDAEARQEHELINVLADYITTQSNRPKIFLEYIHNDQVLANIFSRLAELGYKMQRVTKRHFLFKPQ